MVHDPTLVKFGERVRQLRISKGMTQLELADKFHSAESTISRLEKGRWNPSLLWLIKLSVALEVSFAELVPDELLKPEQE